MVKERPILFNTPMVRAILDGRKTRTRRIVRPQPTLDERGLLWWNWSKNAGSANIARPGHPSEEWLAHCPHGQPGDRLWVRETWGYNPDFPGVPSHACYRADPEHRYDRIKWKPSIHMPRSVCRTMLEVTGVRVERLNDCSKADAIAEGAPPSHPSIDRVSRQFGYQDFTRSWYAQLWEEINGAGSWAANPWVWVVEFRMIAA